MRNCMRKSPAPLIDIGVNLVDHAFEKVNNHTEAGQGTMLQQQRLHSIMVHTNAGTPLPYHPHLAAATTAAAA